MYLHKKYRSFSYSLKTLRSLVYLLLFGAVKVQLYFVSIHNFAAVLPPVSEPCGGVPVS